MGAGAPVSAPAGARLNLYTGRTTSFVIITVVVAACGGLLFGYDIGVSGGVTAMPDFLRKFFPDVLDQHSIEGNSNYCKYENVSLQLFTSSLYLAGLVSSLLASPMTTKYGRKPTMMAAGALFTIGSALMAGAVNTAMLIIGRVVLGLGVGLANQSVPIYLSEVAPYHLRGACNIGFQMCVTLGILAAQLINYGTQYITPNGWRISLGLAGIPSIFLFLGCFFLPESPNSLVQRGRLEQGKAVLLKLRGVEDVTAEFDDLVDAANADAKIVVSPFRTIMRRPYRPQLLLAVAIPVFQQLTGINAIMFYAPQLFDSLGSGAESALINTVIIGAVNVVATVVAIILCDRFGRRFLFLQGGTQMAIAEFVVGIMIATQLTTSDAVISNSMVIGIIVVICVFVSGFAWSWGPLGWLVPTEIQPLQTRSAGQGIAVASNFLLTFVIGQSFLSMLCHMEFGIFFFFGGFCVIMTIFVFFFVPETRNVPIEEIFSVSFGTHWFWKRYTSAAALEDTVTEPGKVAV